ncbi:DUF1345 domain-containing protein [Amaricoccus solimangrovi]|uniref:DUF1345 domain-containing protein n=1 Tax=Amaricoccus solimangrovi TaxID=2589815 RepID=A0A501X089_9RHOB|nr:DUF1345 domain-containing protein [Amaricoccus solimangrovi]TPE53647.1 DUF1345 domain-containing protein [Amaricoccus solimangrovi]
MSRRGGGRRHLGRHLRFYVAVLGGALAFAAGGELRAPARMLLAGDAFFLLYLGLMLRLALATTPAMLRTRAATEDEGMPIILGLTGFAVVFVLGAVFVVVNDPRHGAPVIRGLAVLSVPLGWAVAHLLATFRYADLYYTPAERRREGDRDEGDAGGLDFPGTPEPGIGDFAYYAFVVGMTAQVSDVAVSSGALRRATLAHGIFSFFYNTVLIAFTVNAAVSFAN